MPTAPTNKPEGTLITVRWPVMKGDELWLRNVYVTPDDLVLSDYRPAHIAGLRRVIEKSEELLTDIPLPKERRPRIIKKETIQIMLIRHRHEENGVLGWDNARIYRLASILRLTLSELAALVNTDKLNPEENGSLALLLTLLERRADAVQLERPPDKPLFPFEEIEKSRPTPSVY